MARVTSTLHKFIQNADHSSFYTTGCIGSRHCYFRFEKPAAALSAYSTTSCFSINKAYLIGYSSSIRPKVQEDSQ
jgi:hypothetical protein